MLSIAVTPKVLTRYGWNLNSLLPFPLGKKEAYGWFFPSEFFPSESHAYMHIGIECSFPVSVYLYRYVGSPVPLFHLLITNLTPLFYLLLVINDNLHKSFNLKLGKNINVAVVHSDDNTSHQFWFYTK